MKEIGLLFLICGLTMIHFTSVVHAQAQDVVGSLTKTFRQEQKDKKQAFMKTEEKTKEEKREFQEERKEENKAFIAEKKEAIKAKKENGPMA